MLTTLAVTALQPWRRQKPGFCAVSGRGGRFLRHDRRKFKEESGMIRTISAEWLKLRRSQRVLVIAVLPILGLLIGCANYSMNRGALQNGWSSLWTQVSLFYGEFFLPVLVAICCAYVCRLEHLNKNWNMIPPCRSPNGDDRLGHARMVRSAVRYRPAIGISRCESQLRGADRHQSVRGLCRSRHVYGRTGPVFPVLAAHHRHERTEPG